MTINSTETLQALDVFIDSTEHTPTFKVFEVAFRFVDWSLHLQRAAGDDDDDDGVCLVFSPSQQCEIEPFESVEVSTSQIQLKLTARAGRIFEAEVIIVKFAQLESLKGEVVTQLIRVFSGYPYFRLVEDEPTKSGQV